MHNASPNHWTRQLLNILTKLECFKGEFYLG